MGVLARFTQLFFYGFVFSLPWQTLYFLRETFIAGEKWEYGTIGIYVSDVLLLCFLMCFTLSRHQALWSFFVQQRTHLNYIFGFCLLLFSYLFLSIFWSGDSWLTFYYICKVLFLILLVVSLRFYQYSFFVMLTIFTLSMLGHSFLALWQFFLQDDFSHTLLGVSAHPAWQGGVSVIESTSGRWLRSYGGFFHPNVFGVSMAVMSLLTLCGFVLRGPQRFLYLFFFVAHILFFVALVVSFSRTGFISYFGGLFLFLFLLRRLADYRAFFWKIVGGFTFTYGAILSLFFLFYGDLLLTRVSGEARLERLSVEERTSQIGEALTVVVAHPFFGIGPGSYTKYLYENEAHPEPVWRYQPVHNVGLLLLAELGIIGVSILLGLFFFLLKNGLFLRMYTVCDIAILSAAFAFVVSMVFDHWQWDSHYGLFFAGFLLSFLLLKMNKNY